jgi:hypothetical protein
VETLTVYNLIDQPPVQARCALPGSSVSSERALPGAQQRLEARAGVAVAVGAALYVAGLAGVEYGPARPRRSQEALSARLPSRPLAQFLIDLLGW